MHSNGTPSVFFSFFLNLGQANQAGLNMHSQWSLVRYHHGDFLKASHGTLQRKLACNSLRKTADEINKKHHIFPRMPQTWCILQCLLCRTCVAAPGMPVVFWNTPNPNPMCFISRSTTTMLACISCWHPCCVGMKVTLALHHAYKYFGYNIAMPAGVHVMLACMFCRHARCLHTHWNLKLCLSYQWLQCCHNC